MSFRFQRTFVTIRFKEGLISYIFFCCFENQFSNSRYYVAVTIVPLTHVLSMRDLIYVYIFMQKILIVIMYF